MPGQSSIRYDLDICGCANRLMKRRGEGAIEEAEKNAADALHSGDTELHGIWLRIRDAVAEILREHRCRVGRYQS
jgi:putative NIF3 family GTP cyclohydrolase 1 type 2